MEVLANRDYTEGMLARDRHKHEGVIAAVIEERGIYPLTLLSGGQSSASEPHKTEEYRGGLRAEYFADSVCVTVGNPDKPRITELFPANAQWQAVLEKRVKDAEDSKALRKFRSLNARKNGD
ncbi:MAG: hypothetical protein HYS81_01000 [Candidatus Aenigmatarchaeota archaeon]|nr:MAG: hypothetical protein HYS81_01000 [Candidatus Aenigmarchaeota archaeon]